MQQKLKINTKYLQRQKSIKCEIINAGFIVFQNSKITYFTKFLLCNKQVKADLQQKPQQTTHYFTAKKLNTF